MLRPKLHPPSSKKVKNGLTGRENHCIIYKHEFSDEAECGYSLEFSRGVGNFSGVCHGKDQAVSKALIPKLSCIFWAFI